MPNCGISKGKKFFEGVYSEFLIVRSSELFLLGGCGLPLSFDLSSGSNWVYWKDGSWTGLVFLMGSNMKGSLGVGGCLGGSLSSFLRGVGIGGSV